MLFYICLILLSNNYSLSLNFETESFYKLFFKEIVFASSSSILKFNLKLSWFMIWSFLESSSFYCDFVSKFSKGNPVVVIPGLLYLEPDDGGKFFCKFFNYLLILS